MPRLSRTTDVVGAAPRQSESVTPRLEPPYAASANHGRRGHLVLGPATAAAAFAGQVIGVAVMLQLDESFPFDVWVAFVGLPTALASAAYVAVGKAQQRNGTPTGSGARMLLIPMAVLVSLALPGVLVLIALSRYQF